MARGEFLLRPAGLLSGLLGYLSGNGVYMVLLLYPHVVLGLLAACCMQRTAWYSFYFGFCSGSSSCWLHVLPSLVHAPANLSNTCASWCAASAHCLCLARP